MTAAPAAAAAQAPTAPAPSRVASQPPADRFGFAAVLDSLPGAPGKADASTAEDQALTSNESLQGRSRGQTARHSLLNDSAVLASLPFALRAAAMTDERPQAADASPSLASPAMKGPKSEDSASTATGTQATVGRLVGERAFHLGVSTSAERLASRALGNDAPFGPTAANFTDRTDVNGESDSVAGFSRAKPMAPNLEDAVPSIAKATAPAPIASPALSSNRPSLPRAASHEAARNGRKLEVSAPPPVARASTSASPPAPVGASAKAPDSSLDPTLFAAPSTPQSSPFGAPLSVPFVAGTAFANDGSTTGGANTDIAPRATALATGSASSSAPIKEIDVDLSPGGLENVSMTMRLAGDKLSVVIRAGSSHTLNSIEGARDAIADRLAAIGQPLDSLVIKQAGVSADGNAPSTDHGAESSDRRSAQGDGERGGSNDAGLSRRGAGRDRSF
jgi:Flagellar hook-length control protein FliK